MHKRPLTGISLYVSYNMMTMTCFRDHVQAKSAVLFTMLLTMLSFVADLGNPSAKRPVDHEHVDQIKRHDEQARTPEHEGQARAPLRKALSASD
jgi:hypothetical protein